MSVPAGNYEMVTKTAQGGDVEAGLKKSSSRENLASVSAGVDIEWSDVNFTVGKGGSAK
jgi:hypothetical protein